MPVSKKQLGRLLRLSAQLKENRYPNCARFAAELRKADLYENLNLACTEKTIHRDIQVLKRDFAAPIRFDKKRNGYYLAHHGWTFACPQLFEDSEMLAAILGARVAEHIFPDVLKTQIREAVDYLLSYNNPDFLDKTQVDSLVVIPSNRIKINPEIFMPLFYAWQNHQVCHIVYADSRNNTAERDFEPHSLVFFEGFWYTKGYCRKRQDIRTLAVARIKSIHRFNETFEVRSEIVNTVTEDSIFDAELATDVVIHCDEYLTNFIDTRPLHPDQRLTFNKDRTSDIHIKSIPKYRLITWIMHQCGRAEIICPHEYRNELVSFGKQIMLKHQAK